MSCYKPSTYLLATGILLSQAVPLLCAQNSSQNETTVTAILEEYDITGTTTNKEMRQPGSTLSADYSKFIKLGVADAGDVARYTPGVSIPSNVGGGDSFVPYRGSGYSSYRIRGVDGNRVLVTIDGIRLPSEVDGAGGNGRDYFDPSVFEGVEILRGSGSALYGSESIGGAVQFQTRSLQDQLKESNKSWLLSNRAGYRSVNEEWNHVLNAAVESDRWFTSITNSLRIGHEFQNDKGSTDPNPQDNWSNHTLGKITYSQSSEAHLTVTAEHFTRDSKTDLNTAEGITEVPDPLPIIPPLINTEDAYYAYNETEDSRTRLSLNYTSKETTNWWDELTCHLYYQMSETESVTDTKIDFYPWNAPTTPRPSRDRTDKIKFEHDTLGSSARILHNEQFWDMEHAFTHGFEFSLEDASNDFHRNDRIHEPDDLPELDRPAYDQAEVIRADVYSQDTIQVEEWTFEAGFRASYYAINPKNSDIFLNQREDNQPPLPPADDYTNFSINPSASITYDLSPKSILWGRYARAVGNLGVEDYVGFFEHNVDGTGNNFVRVANPDLEEETSDAFELGIKFAGDHLEIETTAFYTFYNDFIEVTATGEQTGDGSDIQRSENIGEVEIYGIDFRIDYQLRGLSAAFDGFSVGSSFNWTEGENKTENDNVNSVDPFTSVSYIGYDSINRDTPWGIKLLGTYRAKKTDTTENYAFFIPPSSFVLDLTAYWAPRDNVTINGGIRNLTDEKYWIWGSASSADHAFNANEEHNAMPGINAYLSVNIAL